MIQNSESKIDSILTPEGNDIIEGNAQCISLIAQQN